MLISGVLKFDPQGRIILSGDDALYFNGGTPIAADGGLASFTEGQADVYLGGIGYTVTEKLTDSNNPLVDPDGPFTNRNGQVRVSTGLPAFWYAGLPLTIDGYLSVSPGIIPPIDEGAFDNSFDGAFDIGD